MIRIKIYLLVLCFLPMIYCSCDKDPDIKQIVENQKDDSKNEASDKNDSVGPDSDDNAGNESGDGTGNDNSPADESGDGTGNDNSPADESGDGTGDGNDNDEGSTVSLLNFLGDSIIALWKNVSDFFQDYDCHNYGWSAKGIDTFLGRVNIEALEGTECVVEIGTNDMRSVINAGTIDSYIEHYIDVLISLKAKRIYLLSLLPRNRTKDGGFDFNGHYPEINKKIEERVAVRMNNVVYIPLYEQFLKDGKINSQYSGDGLHPNAKGYELMAKIIREYLVK